MILTVLEFNLMEVKMSFGAEVSVASSSIKAFSHNKEDKKLRVQFQNGGIYEYANVSAEKFEYILGGSMTNDGSKSASIGAAVYQELVTKDDEHPFKRIW